MPAASRHRRPRAIPDFRSDAGRLRGPRVSALNANARPGDAAEGLGYPGTYYPGVADAAQAQTVTVSLGQELNSVAFSLVPRVSPCIGNGDELGRESTCRRDRCAAPGSERRRAGQYCGGGGRNQVRPDGTFRLTSVPPGEYVLDVQQRPQNPEPAESQPAQLEFASVPLSVAGDIDGLTVVTTTGCHVVWPRRV